MKFIAFKAGTNNRIRNELVWCLVLIAVLQATANANDDLLQAMKRGQDTGLQRYLETQYVVVESNTSAVYTFVGGGNAGLVEYVSPSGELFVDCVSPKLAFRLVREPGKDDFGIQELSRSSNDQTDVAAGLVGAYLPTVGPYSYYGMLVQEYLQMEDVIITQQSTVPDENQDELIRINWEWDIGEEGFFEGYFIFNPRRNWAVERFGRSRDLSKGEMGVIYNYPADDPTECLFSTAQHFKKPVGQPIEYEEHYELTVLGSTPEPPSRFVLSYYGLSDEIGIANERRWLPISIMGLFCVMLFWLLFRMRNATGRIEETG